MSQRWKRKSLARANTHAARRYSTLLRLHHGVLILAGQRFLVAAVTKVPHVGTRDRDGEADDQTNDRAGNMRRVA